MILIILLSGRLKLSLADIEHLPKVATDVKGIKDILLAIDPELVLVRSEISNLKRELYVRTTEKFIRRWEKDFNLVYDASLSLEQRRQRILNKLARKKPLNWANLRLLIKNNLAKNVQFYISNNAAGFSFKIMVQTADYSEMEKAVKEAKPAYLIFDVLTVNAKRICGTFNCGTEPL